MSATALPRSARAAPAAARRRRRRRPRFARECAAAAAGRGGASSSSGGDGTSTRTVEAEEGASASASTASEGGEGASAGQLALKVLSSPLFYVTAGFAGAARLVGVSGDSSFAVVGLAALPIVALSAVGNTSAGDGLKERAARDKKAYEVRRPAVEEARAAARARRTDAFGAARTLVGVPPAQLRGEVAGDLGLDPFNLGAEDSALPRLSPFDPRGNEARKGNFERLYELELLHARWAMLAVPGAAAPEALQRLLGVDLGGEDAVWYRVGAAKLAGRSLDYFGIEGLRVAGGTGVLTIALAQLVLMGGPEYARYCGIEALEPVGVFLPGDTNYPGGAVFDPFGLADDPDAFVENQLREVLWGRVAMVAFVGICAQAWATRDGPVANLVGFLADPARHNVFAVAAGGR